MSLEAVIDAIKKHDKFLITAHINLEADALGSQLAFYELLKKLGKQAVCVDNDKVPAHFKFLPGVENIKNKPGKFKNFDVACVLDCPTLKRIGRVNKYLDKAKLVLNIDHHISNDRFGDINWVRHNASSAGEMIYALYKKMGIAISKKGALYIYIAILTDTGSFNYSNTSSVTHEIVSDLLGYGLEPQDISRYIYENKTYEEIKLLGKALLSIKFDKNRKIAYMACTKDMLTSSSGKSINTENFINFVRSIKDVQVAMFLRENLKKPKLFNVSFRSKGSVDVNRIASRFGGGGHKNAAGCVVRGTLAEVKKKILAKAREALK